jgi:hypothetical protein
MSENSPNRIPEKAILSYAQMGNPMFEFKIEQHHEEFFLMLVVDCEKIDVNSGKFDSKYKDKLIDVDELDDLLDQMYEKGINAHNDFKYTLVRVMNGGNWMSFKDLDTLEDYYSGKVKDDSKFYEFMQVQITCVFS